MRLEQFEYVVAVADAGSMNAAAQKLHVSQQNISKAIKQLEKDLQVVLFHRSKTGVTLTNKGQILYKFAYEQLIRYSALQKKLQQIKLEALLGTLSVATMNSGSSMIIPQMLCEFYKNYPNVTLEISDGTAQYVIEQVQQNRVDLGIITYANIDGEVYPRVPDELHLTPLLKGKWYFWVSTDSTYAEKGFITFEEANRESIILDDAIDLTLLADIFATKGLAVNIGRCIKNLYLLGQLVAEQLGVFPDMRFINNELLYSYVFSKQSNLVAVPVQPEGDYSAIGCLTNKNEKRDLLVFHTINFLESIVMERGD